MLRVRFFDGGLKVCESPDPHLVEVGAETGDALGVELIEAACTGFAVHHEPGIFEHFEVLRHGWTADGKEVRQLIDGQGTSRKFLEDSHARGVAEGIETGLEVSVHRVDR